MVGQPERNPETCRPCIENGRRTKKNSFAPRPSVAHYIAVNKADNMNFATVLTALKAHCQEFQIGLR
jgi:hypothetical protein